MKLWLLSQDVNSGWDTYDSCVVAAKDEASARLIHPSKYNKNWISSGYSHDWANVPAEVKVELIGSAVRGTQSGVICSSFNAG